jgi:ABC-type lipoprotein export system ATPase subunit
LLERIDLLDRRAVTPRELSGGQQQRIAIAAALAHRPTLFIADEPTGELDAESASQVYTLIGELAREGGATTIVVSHDPHSAGIADRVVQIRDGRVATEDEHAVVGAGGWLRIPELEGASRVRLERAPGAVVVRVEEMGADQSTAPPADGAVVVHTHELVKDYRDARVLDGLSLAFRAGRVTAVTGRSGSGKSTLLRLLAGLDVPTAGGVTVLDEEISQLDRAERALVRRRHIGVVTQGGDLVPFLTARETVELAGGGDETLVAVGLEELAHQRVSRLSMGERQRVAVARALARKPAVLLADEPTARLDEANARAVGRLFAELAATHGTAIVCATHDPVLVEQAADAVNLAA